MAMPADQVIRHRFHDDDDDIDADYPDEYQMLGEEPVQMEKDFASCIIVDNLPVVGKDKYEKLHNVVSKIYTQIPGGKVVQIYMPEDVKGATMGFAFIEFSTPEAAKNAVAQTNGYKLDRAHIFKVNMYDDFQIYEKVAENFDSIEMPPYKPKVINNDPVFRNGFNYFIVCLLSEWLSLISLIFCRKTCGGG